MKKSASLQPGQKRPPLGRSTGTQASTAAATAAGVKLSRRQTGKPPALLEEHSADDHEAHQVYFEYYNPTAKAVSVAGSFNHWQPDATPMEQDRGGQWTTLILLPPGRYEYRFVVDGEWLDDPMATRFVANSLGGLNCVFEVKSMTAARRP